jgi:hypothetical protein
MTHKKRNPGCGAARARGIDRLREADRREDTEAVALGQAVIGPMLGLASCHAANARRELICTALAADFVGLKVEPALMEGIIRAADELIALADEYGHAEAIRRWGAA